MKPNAIARIAGLAVAVAIAAGSARADDRPPDVSQGTCVVIGGDFACR